MGATIVHHDGWFFEWSSVADAPRTYGMRRDEFEAFYRDHYGENGLKDLSERIERAVKKGTSSFHAASAEELIAGNRAGPDETSLPFKDIIRIFCIERPTD